ncbi:hypothetical protein NGE42_21300, partial [Klebsiella pneumoniae]|nr:hypothetical protein [Klebsiella pneumoniae]
VFAGKKSAQIREILINESAWEEMTCLFALSLCHFAGSEYPLLIIIFSVFIGQVLSMHDAKARMFSL